MKIITIGNGFVANHLPYPIISEKIYSTFTCVNDFLDAHKPDVLINCIGFCGGPGRNIDGCEENKEKTFYTNTILPIMIATECEKRNIRLIQIGSGCIYYGESPNTHYDVSPRKYGKEDWQFFNVNTKRDSGWKEHDAAHPLSTYSKSKYACDIALSAMKNVTTLRIRMPISHKAEPRNLLSKLIGYNQIVEAPNSVTFLKDLSRAVDWAISREAVGTYHVASPKPLTHSQILNEYKKHVPDYEFTSISPTQLDGLVAAPRSNCIIDSSKIAKEGFEFLDQDEELKLCVKEFALNNKR